MMFTECQEKMVDKSHGNVRGREQKKIGLLEYAWFFLIIKGYQVYKRGGMREKSRS